METMTIFREPGESYYTVVIDGRIVDSLGKDETLMTVACHLIGSEPPPYAKGKTMSELRDHERTRGVRAAERDAALTEVRGAETQAAGHFGGLPWEPWAGGEMPVRDDVKVDIRLRDGTEYLNRDAEEWQWRHYTFPDGAKGNGDIIAWRRA